MHAHTQTYTAQEGRTSLNIPANVFYKNNWNLVFHHKLDGHRFKSTFAKNLLFDYGLHTVVSDIAGYWVSSRRITVKYLELFLLCRYVNEANKLQKQDSNYSYQNLKPFLCLVCSVSYQRILRARKHSFLSYFKSVCIACLLGPGNDEALRT